MFQGAHVGLIRQRFWFFVPCEQQAFDQQANDGFTSARKSSDINLAKTSTAALRRGVLGYCRLVVVVVVIDM